MSELTATLIINITDSRCGHCGKNVLAQATYHDDVSGRPGAGCGARFVDTGSDYIQITPEQLQRTRPDLPVRAH